MPRLSKNEKRRRRAELHAATEKLRAKFKAAIADMQQPGHDRDWMDPFLKELLRAYRKLRRTKIGGVRVYLALGSTRRSRVAELIRRTTNRDRRTRSRWAGVIARALRKKVKASELRDWLDDGGGIAGRS